VAQPESVNTSVALLQLQSMPGVPKPLAGRLTVAVRYAALENAAEAERLLAPMRVAGHASDVVAATAPWSTGEQFSNFAPSSDPGRAPRCYDEDTRHWLTVLAERYDPAGVLGVGQEVRCPP